MNSENVNKEIFETLSVPKAVQVMAVPMIISQLIVLIYNMADTFFVGRTANPYMVAGVSMVLPVFSLALCIASLAGVGGGTLISRLLGRGKNDEARRVSVFSIYLSVLIAAVFSLVMFVYSDSLLMLIGAGENTLNFARQYAFFVLVMGGIPTVLSNVFAHIIRSVGYSKKASFGIAMGGILNIGLDPLFMFVIFPRGMEATGAGVATLVSNCLACLYFLVTLYRTRNEHVITMNPTHGMPSGESIKSLFGVGIPSSIAPLLFDLSYATLDKLMVSYSDVALAAIGIVLKAERLPLNIGVGICQGMVPLIAYNYASRDFDRMDAIVSYSRKAGIFIGIASVVLYEFGAPYLLRFFIDEPQTVRLGTYFLRVRILATTLMFLCFFTVNTFNAFGIGKMALFLAVLRFAIVNIPMLFIMNWIFGMNGLVWSQFVSDVFVASSSLLIYRAYRNNPNFAHP